MARATGDCGEAALGLSPPPANTESLPAKASVRLQVMPPATPHRPFCWREAWRGIPPVGLHAGSTSDVSSRYPRPKRVARHRSCEPLRGFQVADDAQLQASMVSPATPGIPLRASVNGSRDQSPVCPPLAEHLSCTLEEIAVLHPQIHCLGRPGLRGLAPAAGCPACARHASFDCSRKSIASSAHAAGCSS